MSRSAEVHADVSGRSVKSSNISKNTLILGGGLTGLSAGCVLSRSGHGLKVLEADSTVGGLSKTISHNGFRFDLGGHRFFTVDERLNDFVKGLMGDELVTVQRSSRIFMKDRLFDYPLRPANAFFGLGPATSLKIFFDYALEKGKDLLYDRKEPVSLEDWVIRNFGRKMFDIYFKVYSEKVWGIDCSRISAEWVDRRINGLSLATTIKNAIFRAGGRKIPTLVDEFLYPKLGIGRLSDRLREEIDRTNEVLPGTRVTRIDHREGQIIGVGAVSAGEEIYFESDNIISTLPLTHVVRMLRPAPPDHIIEAASRLRFRDLVVVAVMLDKSRVTDQTWIYIPEKSIPFGRIHEPTNWSLNMAPEGKTLLVIEYFSFKGDQVWNSSDDELVRTTVDSLERLGFAGRRDVCDSTVVRVPKAYPLFEVGYNELCNEIYDYLAGFENIHLAGRSGMFRYYNMDHALESGMRAAEAVIASRSVGNRSRRFMVA